MSTTTQGELYTLDRVSGTGDDKVANLDDSYAVGPFCRPKDDGANAGNEWIGAWSHSNPVEGEDGVYRFEIARTMTTSSSATDAQMAPGGTYEFGIAWFDPYETDAGWTPWGHYTTGCSAEWMDLKLEESSSFKHELGVISMALMSLGSLFLVAL